MIDNRLQTLATNISHLREQMDLSVDMLAEIVGSSRSNINKLENMKTLNPGLPLIESLAAYFGVTVDQLRNIDVRDIKKRDIAIQRLKTNLTDTEFEVMISMIEGLTAAQARNGQFRSSTVTTVRNNLEHPSSD